MAVAGLLYNRLKRYFAEFTERLHPVHSMNNGVGQKTQQQSQVSVDNSSGTEEKCWYLSLVKGPDPRSDVQDADFVSVTEFNEDASLFATGDKGGRIVVFKRCEDSTLPVDYYEAYVTFVSHEPEFDYLKSLEIEEKINKIKFLRNFNPSHYLLSSNDKTIKLWKLIERRKRIEHSGTGSLSLPRVLPLDTPTIEAQSKAVYKNGHTYHINALSLSSDGETFISSDDLRINLWHINVQDQLFNIVDMKPANMEDLTEVITSAECHPIACNLFAYTSSKGMIRLCDLRTSALCDQCYKLYETKDDSASRNFFSEIISSMSDVRFSHSGDYMLTRDYLSLKVWDCRQQTGPVEQYAVHNHLKQRLCLMYENDCIFDKFDCCWSGDDGHLITGSYGNLFTTVNRKSGELSTYEASLENASMGHHKLERLPFSNLSEQGIRRFDQSFFDRLDYSKRILHCAWSPRNDCLTVAAGSNLFFYSNHSPDLPEETSISDAEN